MEEEESDVWEARNHQRLSHESKYVPVTGTVNNWWLNVDYLCGRSEGVDIHISNSRSGSCNHRATSSHAYGIFEAEWDPMYDRQTLAGAAPKSSLTHDKELWRLSDVPYEKIL